MKRFLLFVGSTYEACGGWEDFIAAYGSLRKAKADAEANLRLAQCSGGEAWAHIVDTNKGKVVFTTTSAELPSLPL